MQTYSQKLYECKAKQGRDEPPAEQCRMGVSMGYPPLTQKFLVLKKNCVVEKSGQKAYVWFDSFGTVIILHLRLFHLTH